MNSKLHEQKYCIGITRARTRSLHHFLNAAGFKAIPGDKRALIVNRADASEAIEKKFFDFLEQSEIEASTGNPKCTFFKVNCNRNPQAFIVNTARQPKEILSIQPNAIRSEE